MALENGHYEPVVAKKVTHWPLPDKNGDGAQVWREETDGQGNSMGRSAVTDSNGFPVYEYSAPEGFRNVPSKEAGSDGVTDNYVKVDERGRVWRHPQSGHAARIVPGSTLVEHPNGDFHQLYDDFSRYLFEMTHQKVDSPVEVTPIERPKTAEQKKTEQAAAEFDEFRAWKNARAQAKSVAEETTPPKADS